MVPPIILFPESEINMGAIEIEVSSEAFNLFRVKLKFLASSSFSATSISCDSLFFPSEKTKEFLHKKSF